jgi:hypothetical protein
MMHDHRRERILGRLRAVLLSPVFAVYGLWSPAGLVASTAR